MSVNGKFDDIAKKDLLEVANRFGIGEAPEIISEVSSHIQKWPLYAGKAGVSSKEIRRIKKELRPA